MPPEELPASGLRRRRPLRVRPGGAAHVSAFAALIVLGLLLSFAASPPGLLVAPLLFCLLRVRVCVRAIQYNNKISLTE